MGTPIEPAAPQTAAADILGKSFSLYFAKFGQYLIIPACVLLPAYIINAVIDFVAVRAAMQALMDNTLASAGVPGGPALVRLLTGAIQWAAMGLCLGLLAKIAAAHAEGKAMTAREAFAEARPALGAVITGSVLFGLAVSIGLFLLVIPGLAALFFFCLVPNVVALGGESAFSAFGRSARIALKVPLDLVLILVIGFVYQLLAALIAGVLGVIGVFTVGPFVSGIVAAAFAIVLAPWLSIALTLVYRRGKELGA